VDAMTSNTDSQICANACVKATVGQPCAHCPLIEAQRDAEREDEAWEVQQTLNDCRSIQIIKSLERSIAKTDELTAPMLDQSANRVDLVLLGWFALVLIIAVMWAFGQSSPVRMCGGV